jgi:hypothetical protein
VALPGPRPGLPPSQSLLGALFHIGHGITVRMDLSETDDADHETLATTLAYVGVSGSAGCLTNRRVASRALMQLTQDLAVLATCRDLYREEVIPLAWLVDVAATHRDCAALALPLLQRMLGAVNTASQWDVVYCLANAYATCYDADPPGA